MIKRQHPKAFLLLVIIGSVFSSVFAQDDHSSTAASTPSRFKVGLSLISNDVYNGRKDTLPVPYATPRFTYQHKSGLYADTRFSFLTSSYATRLDVTTVSAGYRHYVTDDLYLSAALSKYFFNASSVSVRSAIKGDASAALSYDVGSLFSVDAGADLVFNSGPSDIFLNLGLSKDVDLDEEGDWSISPAVMTTMGTRNYHEQYLNSRTTKKTPKKKPTVPGTVTVLTDYSTVDAGKILPLDLEMSLPLYYMKGPWTISASPVYVIPFSPATYKVTTTTTKTVNGSTTTTTKVSYQKETISPSFYLQVGLTYKFGSSGKG